MAGSAKPLFDEATLHIGGRCTLIHYGKHVPDRSYEWLHAT